MKEKFIIDSIIVLEKARIVQFVVDTGAKFTYCNYKVFDKTMCEEDFVESEVRMIGGFVEGAVVKFYKCGLKQLTIGNIDMHEQYIWITFDKRVKDIVLGMDILKQITFIADSYKEMMYFCKDHNEYKSKLALLSI